MIVPPQQQKQQPALSGSVPVVPVVRRSHLHLPLPPSTIGSSSSSSRYRNHHHGITNNGTTGSSNTKPLEPTTTTTMSTPIQTSRRTTVMSYTDPINRKIPIDNNNNDNNSNNNNVYLTPKQTSSSSSSLSSISNSRNLFQSNSSSTTRVSPIAKLPLPPPSSSFSRNVSLQPPQPPKLPSIPNDDNHHDHNNMNKNDNIYNSTTTTVTSTQHNYQQHQQQQEVNTVPIVTLAPSTAAATPTTSSFVTTTSTNTIEGTGPPVISTEVGTGATSTTVDLYKVHHEQQQQQHSNDTIEETETTKVVNSTSITDTTTAVTTTANTTSVSSTWIELFDETSGYKYYMNSIDGTTSWEIPTTTEAVIVNGSDTVNSTTSLYEQQQQQQHGDEYNYHVFEQPTNVQESEDVPVETTTTTISIEQQHQQQQQNVESEWMISVPDTTTVHDLHVDDNSVTVAASQSIPEEEKVEEHEQVVVSQSGVVLPMGWIQLYDETTGYYYYMNECTGITSWEIPNAVDNSTTDVIQHYDNKNETEKVEGIIEVEDEVEVEGTPDVNDTITELNDPNWYNTTTTTTTTATTTAAIVESNEYDYYQPEDVPTARVDSMYDRNDKESYSNYENDIGDDVTKPTSTTEIYNDNNEGVEEKVNEEIGFNYDLPETTTTTNTVTAVEEQTFKFQLPDGYTMYYDDNTGVPYYVNEIDGTTSWELPVIPSQQPAVAPPSLISTAPHNDTNDTIVDSNTTNDPPEQTISIEQPLVNDEPIDEFTVESNEPELRQQSQLPTQPLVLPDGWIELLDPDSGIPYYMNEIEGITTWDPPPQQQQLEDPEVEVAYYDTNIHDDIGTNVESEVVTIEANQNKNDDYNTRTIRIDDGKDTPTISNRHNTLLQLHEKQYSDHLNNNERNEEVDHHHQQQQYNNTAEFDESTQRHDRHPEANIDNAVETTTVTTTASSQPLLPAGWIELYDNDSGMPYYLNEIDGTASWDPPPAQTEEREQPIVQEDEIELIQDHNNDNKNQSSSMNGEQIIESTNLVSTADPSSEKENPVFENNSAYLQQQSDSSYHNADEVTNPETHAFKDSVNVPIVDEQVYRNTREPNIESRQPELTTNAGTQLPEGWVELFDEGTGLPYFMNEADGTTSWDPPIANIDYTISISTSQSQQKFIENDPHLKNDTTAAIIVNEETKTHTAACNKESNLELLDEIDTLSKGNLPDGWIALFDETTGLPYYLNEVDGTTSWDPPTISSNSDNEGFNRVDEHGEKIMENSTIEEITTDTPAEEAPYHEVKSFDPNTTSHGHDGAPAIHSNPEIIHSVILQSGWIELFDEQSGQKYFLNEIDGTTSWEHPSNINGAPFNTTDVPLHNENFEKGNDISTVGVIQQPDENILEESANQHEEVHDDINITRNDIGTGNEDEMVSGVDHYVTGSDRYDSNANEDGINEDDDDNTYNYVAALPPGWKEVFDDVSGKPYYHSEIDGTILWAPPTTNVNENEMVIVTDPPSTMISSLQQNTNFFDDSNDVTLQNNENDILPIGWSRVIDDVSGEVFYYNELDGSTTWDPPKHKDDRIVLIDVDNKPHNGKYEEGTEQEDNYDISSATVAQDSSKIHSDVWKEMHTETGQQYFYNEETGESEWEMPVEVNNADAFVESIEADSSLELPEGWVAMSDPSSDEPYFFNEALGITSWNRPLPINSNVETLNVNKHPIGRPQCAIGTFGFGGRLCHAESSGPSGKGVVVVVRRIHNIAFSESLVKVERLKAMYGIKGPFSAADDELVSTYLEAKSVQSPDLLWRLILTTAKSNGTLRSMDGVSDSNSPEARIVKLISSSDDHDITHNPTNPVHYLQSTDMKSYLRSVDELLKTGKLEDAVDKAVSCGDFALALIIARCCPQNVYARAVQRFANSNYAKYPSLHTMTLLLSGQLLASGLGLTIPWKEAHNEELRRSWKNYLIAILSTRTEEWSQLVLSLGNRLEDTGEIIPAHFCYIVGGRSVGSFGSKCKKLLLLGCDLDEWDIVLASDESIEAFNRTEAYEWAKRRGNPRATIPSLQPLKVMYAIRLVDYGFVDIARRYIDNILQHVSVNPENLGTQTTLLPLSLSIKLSDQSGLLLALINLSNRLSGKIPIDDCTSFADKQNTEASVVGDESDVNSSFVTAITHVHDALIVEPQKGTDVFVASSSLNNVGSQDPHPIVKATQRVDPLTEQDPKEKIVENVVPASTKEMEPSDVTIEKAMKYRNSNSAALKIETAPMSAPPNLQSATKKATPTSAPPSKKGLFDFGLKDTMTKWLNPDATTADLGNKMEAYYDEKLKVWVFPGEDPAEIAKPIGPPPIILAATTNADKKQSEVSVSTDQKNLDPLAAMMAPPKRGPTAASRSRGANTSLRPSPASMPIMVGGPNNKFSVFTPPPTATITHDDN